MEGTGMNETGDMGDMKQAGDMGDTKTGDMADMKQAGDMDETGDATGMKTGDIAQTGD